MPIAKARKPRQKREVYVEPVIPPEALAWPTEPEPIPVDIAAELEGKPFGTLYVGWWMDPYFSNAWNSQSNIGKGCCSISSHSSWRTDRTDCQGTGRFYATKADAVLALRWARCRIFAKALYQLSQLPKE